MAAGDGRPIIIRRKKAAGQHGHHGGAWKVAYADFVTAMMAFFLLMWLLNATSENMKRGLADYFDSRVPIVRGVAGGDGAFGGEVMRSPSRRNMEEGGGATVAAQGRASGRGDLRSDPKGEAPPPAAEDEVARREAEAFAAVEDAFEALSGESEVADPALGHIRTRVTEEGLVIDLFEREGEPLFEMGRAEPTPLLRALVEMVASVAALVTNEVALAGHTDSTPFPLEGDDGNWPLSADRAQTARRLLIAAGFEPARIARVSGRAATRPMIAEDPADPRNRRVEITLLRSAR